VNVSWVAAPIRREGAHHPGPHDLRVDPMQSSRRSTISYDPVSGST
jgi:hypothetical protein